MAKTRERAIASLASQPAPSARDSATREFEHEKLLKENSERYLAIVDTAIDAIIVVDRFGQVQSFNRAAEKIFGYSAAEVIGDQRRASHSRGRPSQPRRLLPRLFTTRARARSSA